MAIAVGIIPSSAGNTPDPAGLCSLETSDRISIFDIGNVDPGPAHVYIQAMDRALFTRRCAVTPSPDAQIPRVMGRVVWIGREV